MADDELREAVRAIYNKPTATPDMVWVDGVCFTTGADGHVTAYGKPGDIERVLSGLRAWLQREGA